MTTNHSNRRYIAHVRKVGNSKQTVATHLQEVAEIAKTLAAKINVPEAGELIGLLHNIGTACASPKHIKCVYVGFLFKA